MYATRGNENFWSNSLVVCGSRKISCSAAPKFDGSARPEREKERKLLCRHLGKTVIVFSPAAGQYDACTKSKESSVHRTHTLLGPPIVVVWEALFICRVAHYYRLPGYMSYCFYLTACMFSPVVGVGGTPGVGEWEQLPAGRWGE